MLQDPTNSSNLTSTSDEDWFADSWIAAQIINVILLFLTGWIFSSLFCFGTRKDRLKWKAKKDTTKLIILALFCHLFSFMTYLLAQSQIFIDRILPTGSSGNLVCEVIMDTSIVIYTTAYVSTYVFLWYRMEILYSKPLLMQMKTRINRFLSLLSLLRLLLAVYIQKKP